MNKKFLQNSSNLNPSTTTIPRIKSLIKPPPSRTSWELLLDDYLNDSNLKRKFSPNNSPNLYQQSIRSTPQSTYSYPIQQTFIPNNSSLPPRRYRMNLDELVYLISQVGRSDLYREMVEYIKSQSTEISNSHSNINHYFSDQSKQSFFLHSFTKHKNE